VIDKLFDNAVGAGDAGDEAASCSNTFGGKISQIWAHLLGFGQDLGKIKAKFGKVGPNLDKSD